MYRLHYAPDNASMIVRMVLEELAQPYEVRLVDRRRGAQRAAAYLALNPAGRIPVLETDEGALFETGAILLYLADRHGALFPAPDAPGRGKALTWLFYLSNTVHATMVHVFYSERLGDGPARDPVLDRLMDQARSALYVMEAAYSEAGTYLLGETPCLCDFYLGCLLRWSVLYPADRNGWGGCADFPRLARMAGHLQARASVRRVAMLEGLGETVFTQPRYATPKEGAAL